MSSVFDLRLFGSVIVTLLVIMNPMGAVPIFLALTRSLTFRQRVVSARRASLVALGVIAAFAVFGQQILSYLHISLAALQGGHRRSDGRRQRPSLCQQWQLASRSDRGS